MEYVEEIKRRRRIDAENILLRISQDFRDINVSWSLYKELFLNLIFERLSDKECNVLTKGVYPIKIKAQEIDGNTKVIITEEEDLHFEKGFLEADVKQAVYNILERIDKLQKDIERIIKEEVGDKLI